MNITTRDAANRQAGDFTRVAKSLGQTMNSTDALDLAENTRASERAVKALRQKAATTAATLADDNWAGNMADVDGSAANFIESLRPQSIFYRLVQQANVYPMRSRILTTAALPVSVSGEGQWLPVVAGSFSPVTLQPRKCGAIIVVSKELIEATDAASFAVLRRELQTGARAAVDDLFLSIALDGITPTAAPDLMVGIAGLLDDVALTGAERLVFVAGVKMANKLSTATDTAGARLFPTMGPTGGKLLGLDVMVSDRIDAETLALLDAAGFNANEGAIDVDRSDHASLQMRTDPADEAAETVNMFHTNSVALRVIAGFGAERIRDEAVAAIKLGA